jgi:hypothetical protein
MTIERIDAKLDRILDKLGEHSEVLAKHGVIHEQNSSQLATHIARTNALEEHMDLEHRDMKKNLETALQPIKAFKFLTKLAAGALTLAAALKLFGVI